MASWKDDCVKPQRKEQAKTYEEAISIAGHGKFHYHILVICGMCLISMTLETLSNSYVVPAAQCDFNMSSSEKGLLTSIVYVGMILSAHMWGFLADTQGRRKMLIISLCCDIVCSLIASIVPTFPLFVVLRFLNGFFISCASSVAFVYLGEFHSDRTRTKSMIWVCSFFSVGTTSLPAIAWIVMSQTWSFDLPWCSFKSWRIFVLLVSFPAVITCFALWAFVPESPKYLLAAGRKREALSVLQKVYSVNTGNAAELYPVTDLKMENTKVHVTKSLSPLDVLKYMWEQTKPVFMPPYLLSTVLACCIQFGLYATSNGLILWLPEIFNQMNEYNLLISNESVTICTAIGSLRDFHLNTSYIDGDMLEMQSFNQHVNHSVNYSLTADVANVTVEEDFFSMNRSISDVIEECQPNLTYQSFLNTMVMGATSGFAFILVGFLIKFIRKKIMLMVCFIATGCSIIALYFARTPAELIAFPTLIFAFPAMSLSVINNLVVDAFPTRLRAMALGLSLMTGRIGTISSSMLFGALLESNCAVIFILLSAVVIVGGVLALFMPVAQPQE